MIVNNANSVSEALSNGLHQLRVQGIKQPSRVGDVLVSPMPVMTVYKNPMNRVLFSPMRDANPFFHVMESLWMLAGRNDLPWLTQFNKRFAAYSDDGGKTQPGAYGYRWRNYFGYDQLNEIIAELKKNPQTRRAVLAMWDGGAMWDTVDTDVSGRDMSKNQFNSDLLASAMGSADVPCNTHAYFDTIDGRLNMTVCCRSNDIIWGAYGANAVHFSFLLEYMAAAIAIPMGVYRQFSNNFHLYTNVVPENQIMTMARDVEETDRYTQREKPHFVNRVASVPALRQVPLIGGEGCETFLNELDLWFHGDPEDSYDSMFLNHVAWPMFNSYMAFKEKNYVEAIEIAETIKAEDWRITCVEWLQRRQLRADINKVPFTEVASNA